MSTLSDFIVKLKEHLRENQEDFHEHYSMCGDTEGGFYDQDVFDFDKLLAEIDKFSETFRGDSPSPYEQVVGSPVTVNIDCVDSQNSHNE